MNFLKKFNRSGLKEDLRKVGITFIGAGFLTLILLNSRVIDGIATIFIGVILIAIGNYDEDS